MERQDLKMHRSKGQNVSEVSLNREARLHLNSYLEWRRQQSGEFEPLLESPLFLVQDPKNQGQRLGYQGLHKMVEQLGAIAGVEDINSHRFRHTLGTKVTKLGIDPLFCLARS
ncbi:site-specific integrase [Phormidium tenue FACHB-886]|nr:site-specific integrase [Phormidium tenue FACHB-886]